MKILKLFIVLCLVSIIPSMAYAWREHSGWNDNDLFIDQNVLDFEERSTPENPASDRLKLYCKDRSGTTTLYTLDSAGAEVDLLTASSGAPIDATYIVQTADSDLTNEQALGALASGLVYNTTTTGVLSIATESQLESTMGLGFGDSKVATAGYVLVADGVDFESVAISGDAVLSSAGALTITADAIALSADTTGNYVESVATTAPITGGAVGSEAAALTLALTQEVDLVAGTGLSGGANDVMPGSDTDVTLTFDATELDAIIWSDGANASNDWTFNVSGNDTSITFGNGIITINDDLHVGADDATENIIIHDAGILQMYDDSDDTSISLQVSTDGSDDLNLTGDFIASGDITATGGDFVGGTSSVQGTIALHDIGTITVYEDGDNFSASATCKDGASEWLFNDDINIGGASDAENLYIHNAGAFTLYEAGDNFSVDIACKDGIATLLINDNVELGAYYLDFGEISTPANPADNNGRMYAKDNGSGLSEPYWLDKDGTETAMLTEASGAAIDEAFVTIGNDASMTAERAITAGNYIDITDGGANSTVTIDVDPTEMGDITFAAGTDVTFTHTYDISGTTDCTMTYGDGEIDVGGNLDVIGMVTIGDGTYSWTNAPTDLGVEGSSEFDGNIYCDSGLILTTNGSSYQWLYDDVAILFGTGQDSQIVWDTNGTGDDMIKWAPGVNSTFFLSQALNPNNMTDWDGVDDNPTFVFVSDDGADSQDYGAVAIGAIGTTDVTSTWYFNFFATTGSADGSVDVTTAEIAPCFRIGDAGSATTDHSLSSGDVLFEDDIEVDGVTYFDGQARCGSDLYFGAGFGGRIHYEADDGLHVSPDSRDARANNNLIICASDESDGDYNHQPASTNPTLFVHSDTAATSATNQWISLTHDQTDGVIDVGTGNINMNDAVDMGANALDCDSNTVTLSTVAGAIDAGGATSLEIPNGTDPDVDAMGEISIDSDDNILRGYDSKAQYVLAGRKKVISVNIAKPLDLTEADTLPLFENRTQNDFIIDMVYANSDTDNTVFTLKEVTDARDFTALTTIEAITISTDGTGVYYADIAQKSIDFTSGGAAVPAIGDIVTGATSGSTAFIEGISALSGGSWAGEDAAGTLYLSTQSAAFQAENLNIPAQADVMTIGADTTAVLDHYTIEPGHIIVFDNDAEDDPGYISVTIVGHFDADKD